MNKNIVYMVTELDSGETTVFDSMENLLDKFKCVTEARGAERCWEGKGNDRDS